MEISIVGAGYVGLSTAACLAAIGHKVSCADNDIEKLNLLRAGKMPLYEPYLEGLVRQGRAQGKLEFVAPEEAASRNRVLFICVGTPPLANGEADLSSIENVARLIARNAVGYRLVVEKSTVPVQTGHQLQKYLGLYRADHQCEVASNPEFLREGSAIEDFFHPDRIVAGVESESAAALLREIYDPILYQKFECPVHGGACGPVKPVAFLVTDISSAELIKHASNSFLAMKISFINLIADLCEAAGGDIEKVAEGIGLDRRIRREFLRPGVGFGGSCFPKDLQCFVRIASKFDCDFALLEEVRKVNSRRVDTFVEKVKRELWELQGKTICVWGLAFKPETDDVRNAPALKIIRKLLQEGARVRAYDPKAMEKAKQQLPEVVYCADPYDAAKSASATLVLTEWKDFETIDWARMRAIVAHPLIFDGRNMLSPAKVISSGFKYIGIGSAPVSPALGAATRAG